MTLSRKELGDRGEHQALTHLQAAGLRLLERNFRCAGGEIDLVMLDHEVLVLVEVRVRSQRQFGGAAASVTQVKQRRLIVAAQKLLQQRPLYRRYRARFDLVAIDDAQHEHIEWIRHAFNV